MNKRTVCTLPAAVAASVAGLIALSGVSQPGCMPVSMGPGTSGGTTTGGTSDSLTTLYGPRATEDLGFDNEGYLLGAQDGNIFRTAYGGTPEIVVAGAGGGGHRLITGIMMLPDGDIIYCDDQSGSMYRADVTTGAREVVLSGLSYPNGLEMDLSGLVYLAETHANRIRRINVDTGASTIIVSGVPGPDGVSFNPDYDTL
ncbi:MAG: hypothetical protein JXQ73_31970, partial [Phycisphaerae bacterium]|nr:hypothetical protein [Phycisphaerae bacterium]